MNPWYNSKNPDQNKDIWEKYGQPYFPEFKVHTGTNCISVSCEDFTWEDGKTYKELRENEIGKPNTKGTNNAQSYGKS